MPLWGLQPMGLCKRPNGGKDHPQCIYEKKTNCHQSQAVGRTDKATNVDVKAALSLRPWKNM